MEKKAFLKTVLGRMSLN